jgi:hypothetical protein
MAEDEYRRRTNLHAGRPSSAYQKKPAHFHLLRFQMIICVICILAAGVIRLIGGDIYKSVKSGVANALNSPVTYSQVQGVFAAIKSGLPPVSGVFASSGASSGSGAATSSSSGSSSGASSSASGASSAASSAAPSSAASSAVSSSAPSSSSQ